MLPDLSASQLIALAIQIPVVVLYALFTLALYKMNRDSVRLNHQEWRDYMTEQNKARDESNAQRTKMLADAISGSQRELLQVVGELRDVVRELRSELHERRRP